MKKGEKKHLCISKRYGFLNGISLPLFFLYLYEINTCTLNSPTTHHINCRNHRIIYCYMFLSKSNKKYLIKTLTNYHKNVYITLYSSFLHTVYLIFNCKICFFIVFEINFLLLLLFLFSPINSFVANYDPRR